MIKCCKIFILSVLLFSCENSMNDIQRVTFKEGSPDEVIKDFHITFVDSGYSKIDIYSKITEIYHKPISLTKFKDSVRVNFFSYEGVLVSTLSAHYGQISFSEGKMFVRDSVRLFNLKKKQTLETESLYWNQKDSSIYTNSSVIVKTPKAYFYGEGIKTNQEFSNYTFIKPKGTFKINKLED